MNDTFDSTTYSGDDTTDHGIRRASGRPAGCRSTTTTTRRPRRSSTPTTTSGSPRTASATRWACPTVTTTVADAAAPSVPGGCVAGAMAGLLAVSGCARHPGGRRWRRRPRARRPRRARTPHDRTSTSTSRSRRAPTSIAVSWTLTNTGDEPLLVVDRVPRASGAGVVLRPAGDVRRRRRDGLVQIASRLFDLPETDARPTRSCRGRARPSSLPAPPSGATSPSRCRWSGSRPGATTSVTARSSCRDPVTSVQFCLGVVAGEPEPSWGLDRTEGTVTPRARQRGGGRPARPVLGPDPDGVSETP